MDPNSAMQFKKFVDLLVDRSLPISTKLHCYTKLRILLPNNLTKEDVTKIETFIRSLFDSIKLDLASESLNLRQSVLLNLEEICKSTWRFFILEDLAVLCIRISFDEAAKCKNDVRKGVLKCLQSLLEDSILENDCALEKLLLQVKTDADRKEILELLETILKNIPKQRSVLFYYETIVPIVFNTSHVELILCLVDFLLDTLTIFNINCLDADHFEKFKIRTKSSYVSKIVKMLQGNNQNWYKAWIFIVRCYGKKLLGSSDILNALLKVVEGAFRSKVITTTSEAYDCWKELIDTYSLDLSQMCSAKYLKLILLPLKNNAIKDATITKKKFDLWVYLINILQEKSFDILQFFLEYCFGSICEIPLTTTTGSFKMGNPGRNIPELWKLSAQALLEIMGHDEHDDGANCMDYKSKPLLMLENPVVNHDNFAKLDYYIINSIGESCTLMLTQVGNEKNKNEIIKAIRCLWSSLFRIIEQLEKQDQDGAIQRVATLLGVYVDLSNTMPNNLEYILKPVFELLSKNNFYNMDVRIFNKQLLLPSLKRFLKNNDTAFLSGKKEIFELLRSSKQVQCKNTWLEDVNEIFLKTDIKSANVTGLLTLWCNCTDVLQEICDSPTKHTEEVIHNVAGGFMVWPIINVHRVPTEQKTIITDICAKWGSAFINLLKTYTKEALNILRNVEKHMDSTPDITIYFPEFYPEFKCLLDSAPNHNFVMLLVQVTATLLGSPMVTKNVETLILPIVLLIMDYISLETDKTSKFSDFQHMCQCFEHILQLHKEYSILKPLLNFFDKMPKSFRENIPESLHKVVESLTTNSNPQIAEDAQKLLQKFIKRSSTEKFLTPKFMQTSRAAKITNMAMTSPKSNLDTTTVLQLLGHKVESPIRGSLMDNNKPRKRKASNVFPEVKKSKINIEDEEASYVLIDQKYEFDPTKLTDHQVEVMKKRRSDIPALYQDLSQSQSNSQCSMTVKSGEPEEQLKSLQGIFQKVIVEPVPVLPVVVPNEETPQRKKRGRAPGWRARQLNKSQEQEKRDELKIQNPSMKKIESMITDDGKKDPVNEEKRQLKVKKELNNLKMDIVGSNEFLQRQRIRTRRSVDQGIKTTEDGDDSTSTNGGESNKKTKLRATVKIIDRVVKEKLSPKSKTRSPTNNTKNEGEELKRSNVQRKLILQDETDRVKKRRGSMVVEEPSKTEQPRRSKSVSPEKPPANNKKLKKDRNWIAKVNKSLEECGKNKKVIGARKSLNNALEAAHNEFTVTLLETSQTQESEDVIESSQESCIEIKPCQNLDQSIEIMKKNLESEITSIVTQLRKGKVQNSNTVTYVIQNNSPEVNEQADNKIFSTLSLDELMQEDLTSHVKSKQNTNEMDTETLELLSETPTKIKIPTSPIAPDTPNRTNELITNTLDISPIKVVPTPNLFDSEPSTSTTDTRKSPSPPVSEQAGSSNISETNQRSLKLLRMVSNASPAPVENKVPKVKQPIIKPYNTAPKTHRIVKMMETFEKKPDDPVDEVVQLEDVEVAPKNLLLEKDVLKFVKELPSPLASPRNSILKRRAPDSREEGLSPPRKKRVNFSDPPTTCEKVYFKDKNEHKKDDHKELTCDEVVASIQAVGLLTSSTNTDDPPLAEPLESLEPPLHDVITSTKNSEPQETESLGMETQGSIDTTDPYYLEYHQPILPEFIHCKDSVDSILGRLVNPLFCFTLANELEKKRVFTIGDLAKLSEIDITRLPFRTPKVLSVRSAIRKFMAQKSPESKPEESKEIIEENHVNKEEESQPTNDSSLLLTPKSNRSRVNIVSSIIVQAARSVTSTPNSTKQDRSPRRVPLINVTSLNNTPSCSTFMQAAQPIEIDLSSSKESDCSETVVLENVDEKEKLRTRAPQIIADFEQMRENVKREGLSIAALYELIIEIVGAEEFVSILQRMKVLSPNGLVKNDGCTFIDDISRICSIQNVTLIKAVEGIINKIVDEQHGTKRLSTLEPILSNIIEHVPLSNILQKFGMRRSIDALCEMNKCSEFTVEDFFQHATFRFSPNLNDMVPSFRNINIIELNDQTISVSNRIKQDCLVFAQKLREVMENGKNQVSNSTDVIIVLDDLPLSNGNKAVVPTTSVQNEELFSQIMKISEESRKELIFSLFNALSEAHAYEYWTSFHRRHSSNT